MKTVYSKITAILLFVVSNTAFLLAAGNITHHEIFGNDLVEDVPMDESWADEVSGIAADDDEIAEATAPTATITTATTFMPTEGSLLARTRNLHRIITADINDEEEVDEQAAMVAAAQFVEESETSPRQAARDLRRMGILNWFNEHHPA